MARRVSSSSISRVTSELRRLEQERQNTNARIRDLERQAHTLERVAQRTAERERDRDRDTGGRGSIIPDDRRHHRDRHEDRPAKRRALDPSSTSNPASPTSSSDTITKPITVETAADRIRQAREERLRRQSSVETNASSRHVLEPDNALQSVVVAPKEEKEEGEATTHEEEKKTTTTTKPDPRKRDRKMFAGLLGHLASAQNQLTKDRSNAAQLKKIDLEAKIEKKMQEERIREKTVAIQRNKDNIQAAKQRLKDINMKQQQKRTLLLHHIIAAHDLSLSPFLVTKNSSPGIYYLPKTHNDSSRERLEQQTKQRKQHIEETCFVWELTDMERQGLQEILEKGGPHQQEHHKHDTEMEHEGGDADAEVNGEHDESHEQHQDEPEHEEDDKPRRIVRADDEPAITVTMKGDTKAISLRGKRKASERDDDDDDRSSTSPERR